MRMRAREGCCLTWSRISGLNPIARFWYLTGTLELEGAMDPSAILVPMVRMFSFPESVQTVVRGWRYFLDAEASGDERLTVETRVIGESGDLTVRLENGAIVVEDGFAEDAGAVVEARRSNSPTHLDSQRHP